MRSDRFPLMRLLGCTLLSGLLGLLIVWLAASFRREFLDVTIVTSAPGAIQPVYVSAIGAHDERGAPAILHTDRAAIYRFPIPAGTWRAMRIEVPGSSQLVLDSAVVVRRTWWRPAGYMLNHVAGAEFLAVTPVRAAALQGSIARMLTSDEPPTAVVEIPLAAPLAVQSGGLRTVFAGAPLLLALALSLAIWLACWRWWPVVSRMLPSPGVAIGLAWAAVAFALYFEWSAYVRVLGWNAIEFKLAANLREYGRYALGPGFPPALWRPVLAPLILVPLELVWRDPVTIFRVFTASTLSIFVFSMYMCGRRLGGATFGSMAAALTLATSAASTLLLTNSHPLSHLAMFAVLGPAVAVSLTIVDSTAEQRLTIPSRRLVAAGLLWGLCELARPEMILTASPFLAYCVWAGWRDRSPRLALVPAALFLVVVGPHQIWLDREAARYDLVANERIYQFYASQGWSLPRPVHKYPDTEADGYAYAIELYGTPESNGLSIRRAIARNPEAFTQRVRANAGLMWERLSGPNLFPWLVRTLVVGSFLVWLATRLRRGQARTAVLLWTVASISTVGAFVVLHIDNRYLTLTVPFAIVLATYTAATIATLPRRVWLQQAIALAWLAVAVLPLPRTLTRMRTRLPDRRLSLAPIAVLAEHVMGVLHPSDEERARLFVAVEDLPGTSEDTAMFAYLAGIPLPIGVEFPEVYPRDRIFSFRSCPPTHVVARPDSPWARSAGETVGRLQAAEFGSYRIVKLPGAPGACH